VQTFNVPSLFVFYIFLMVESYKCHLVKRKKGSKISAHDSKLAAEQKKGEKVLTLQMQNSRLKIYNKLIVKEKAT